MRWSPGILGVALVAVVLAFAAGGGAEPTASVDELRALLLDPGQTDRARVRAADLLAGLDDPRAEAVLVESLTDSREIVRFGAARALGRPGRPGGVAPLLKTLRSPAESTSLRATAARSLGQIGDPRAVEALMDARREASAELRTAARRALLELQQGAPGRGPITRLGLLSEMLGDREAGDAPRAEAARLLGESADPQAIPLLAEALRAPAPAVRPAASFSEFLQERSAARASVPAAAARALARFPSNEAVPVLVRAAPAVVGEGKVAIVETLAQLRARDALPVFVAALDDPEPRARRWAAFALADLAEREIAGVLRSALGDTDPGVRLHATRALVRLGDVGAVDALVEALRKEPVPPVRDALVDALAMLAPVSLW
jgi:HEAT repeat protein